MDMTLLEQKLLTTPFDNFSLEDKNGLISILANKDGLKFSDVSDDYILQYHKKIKIDILSINCNDSIINGFVSSNGHRYRTNRDDQLNFIGKFLQLSHDTGNQITTVLWKTEDSGYIQHTKQEWISKVFSEGLDYKEKNLFKYNHLKQLVNQAESHQDLILLHWDMQLNF